MALGAVSPEQGSHFLDNSGLATGKRFAPTPPSKELHHRGAHETAGSTEGRLCVRQNLGGPVSQAQTFLWNTPPT